MSSDIYEVKESPWAVNAKNPPAASRRQRRHKKTSFDEVTNGDLSKTHRRRRRNGGLRRFRHNMKKKDFSRKFWSALFILGGSILAVITIWDTFFRYPETVSTDPVEEFARVEPAPTAVPVKSPPPVVDMFANP